MAKKDKYCLLAPIEVEILSRLVFRDETREIETDSGTIIAKRPNISAPNLTIDIF